MQRLHEVKLNSCSLTSLISVLLVFVQLCIAEPMHHHEDHEEHRDCAMCMAATVPFDIVLNFELPLTIGEFTEDVNTCISVLINSDIPSTKSRSPPFCRSV